MSSRNTTIDFLRGLAVLLMILIHATAYFWWDTTAHIIWDYAHFAVPLFVFCSAYIFFKRKKGVTLSFSYIFQRIKRLVAPYYIFLIPLFVFIFFHDPQSFHLEKITTKVFLGSGRDLSWLVVLFLYFMFLIPLIGHLYHHKRKVFWIYTIISLLSSFFFLHHSLHIPFRYVMWLPWSVFLIFALFYTQYENERWFMSVALLASSIVFSATRIALALTDHNLIFTENKYPPNIYYLSYGIFFTTFLYYIHSIGKDKGIFPTYVQKSFHFLSRHSYSLYFIHFIYVIVFVNVVDYKALTWWGFFIVVLLLSIGTQLALNKLTHISSSDLRATRT